MVTGISYPCNLIKQSVRLNNIDYMKTSASISLYE